MKRTINLLQEFSLPLIAGVVIALVWANIYHEGYEHFLHDPILGSGFTVLGHEFNFHFLFNDLFMVFFFGIAAVEITQSVLPGGSLNPISRAINPIMGTLGGVLGPVGVFFILTAILPLGGVQSPDITHSMILNGWGIPTATDIALAWLVARLVFGKNHPAVSYLLLLAVADDAIGLGIIAVFYPDPNHPVEIYYLGLTALGMLLAFAMRKMNVKSMWFYLIIGGSLSWLGLILAHLHPALALVFIVPFMPADTDPKHHHDKLFEDEEQDHSTLVDFEHKFKLFVDLGLLGFGVANAGVVFSNINVITWIIFASLVVGKTVGITLFGSGAQIVGFKLPEGMNFKTLFVAGIVAALGLTVALFVAGEAYHVPEAIPAMATIQGAAKMGALFSAGAAIIALVVAKILKVERVD